MLRALLSQWLDGHLLTGFPSSVSAPTSLDANQQRMDRASRFHNATGADEAHSDNVPNDFDFHGFVNEERALTSGLPITPHSFSLQPRPHGGGEGSELPLFQHDNIAMLLWEEKTNVQNGRIGVVA